jgi:dienelactone hydrolase
MARMSTSVRRGLLSMAVILPIAACELGGATHGSTATSVQEVWIKSRGARLGATLYLPGARGPSPGVVIIHGSGRLTADDVARGVAPRLTPMGLAVLAYDKRGVGRSEGQYSGIGPANSDSMFDLLAADALAGVEFLKSRPEIDQSRIGLFGYSQAGWIAPLAASRSSDVRFVILISGPAVTVGEENAYSDLAGADPGSRQGLSDAEIEREFAAFKGPHGYNPDAAIRSMPVPSLWLLGAKDRSIPVHRTIENLERIRAESSRPISIHVFPDVDHSMRNPGTGEWTDYWPVVATWLQKEHLLKTSNEKR